MVVVQVNPNFHTIGGKSVLRRMDPRFLEYRRKWERTYMNRVDKIRAINTR